MTGISVYKLYQTNTLSIKVLPSHMTLHHHNAHSHNIVYIVIKEDLLPTTHYCPWSHDLLPTTAPGHMTVSYYTAQVNHHNQKNKQKHYYVSVCITNKCGHPLGVDTFLHFSLSLKLATKVTSLVSFSEQQRFLRCPHNTAT